MDYGRFIRRSRGLVAYWRCGDSVGSTSLADQIGANPITTLGTVRFGISGLLTNNESTATSISTACSTAASPIGLSFPSRSPLSVEAIVLPIPVGAVDSTPRRLLGVVGTIESRLEGYELYIKDSGPVFVRYQANASDVVAASTTMAKGVLAHIVGTYDGKYMRIYVNGMIAATPVASTKTIAANTFAFSLCNPTPSSAQLATIVQEVAVYDVAISAYDVSSRYQAIRQIFPDPQRIRKYDRLTMRS